MTPKEEIIEKIQNVLLEEGKALQEDTQLSVMDKVAKVDVLLNLVKFLDDYDENIKVLNKHLRDKKWKGDSNER